MSDHALFYNSVDHDRVYNADSFSDWLKKFFTTGVFTGDLFVSALTGMNVSVGTGYVNINGKVMIYETDTQLTLQPANGIYPRIDTIVVERNDVDRDFSLKVITGDYANLNDPVPTPPVRGGAIYQLVLAQIYVGAGVTEITQANITDTRPDDDLCGIVTGTVTEMDFSQFAAQFAAYYQEFKNGYELDFTNWSTQQRAAFDAWMADEQDDFDTWFANLHYILDGDVAGHLQNEIDALAAGMTGSIFEIQTSESTLIGKTVTVTGPTKTMTATISNAGTAEIRGFDEVGTITISASDGVDTATTIIDISYFGNYPITLAFWQAIVNIQGDENLYGEDILVSDSSHILVDTVTLDSTGQGTFYASKADTYTFTATYSGETYTETLAVTEQTTYSVNIMTLPDGSTVTPTDDIQTWLRCAQILDKPTYTTLSDILSDSITFNALLGDSNANKYLARSTTWATTICADQYAMNLIGQYDVCCDALLGNSTWASAIGSSTYMEYVLNTKVPKMTSNTTPSGVCFASIVEGGVQPYLAFDGDNSTNWATVQSYDDASIGYQFPSAVCIRRAKFRALYGNRQFTVAYSDDGTNYTTCSETVTATNAETDYYVNTTETSPHEYWRLNVHHTQGASGFFVQTVQFYGRIPQADKIHGANEEVAYYLDGATQVPISNPSTLDAGTYTFGSTIAKNPDSLSSDYTKQIRITPNTVEVVLRPDKSLYWWGYNNGVEGATTANGWTGNHMGGTVTFNTNSASIIAGSGQEAGLTTQNSISGYDEAHAIVNTSYTNSTYFIECPDKDFRGTALVQKTFATGLSHDYITITGKTGYPMIYEYNNHTVTTYAMWFE